MAEKWEKQFKDFIKRASEDLKRTGEEIKVETQRLIGEVRDPARQAKVMEAFKDLRDKVATISKEAGEKVEAAMKKVEGAMENAFDKNKPEEPAKAQPGPPPRPSPPGRPARRSARRQAPRRPREPSPPPPRLLPPRRPPSQLAGRSPRPDHRSALDAHLQCRSRADARPGFFQAVRGVGRCRDP
jgi:hypothetical protein